MVTVYSGCQTTVEFHCIITACNGCQTIVESLVLHESLDLS
jgi:hypothetical protein